jgi:hypothetical protein
MALHTAGKGWEIATEVGTQGLNVTMVMLWQPGMNKHPMPGEGVDFAPLLWERNA